LLDDAIREHLELKRRRGADPGEIAHQERDALKPVFDEEDPDVHAEAALDGHADPLGGEAISQSAPIDEEPEPSVPPAPADPVLAEEPIAAEPPLADFSTPGQETAELDMQAVLEEDAEREPDHVPRAPLAAGPGIDGDGEESMDWEFPGGAGSEQAAEQVPEEVPGQERLSFE